MKQYVVESLSVQVNYGVLVLNQEQYNDRRHLLKPTELTDHYEVLAPITFKRGEIFGHDGELSKAVMALVEELDPDQLVDELDDLSDEDEVSDDDESELEDEASDEDAELSDDEEEKAHDVAELAGHLKLSITKTKEMLRDKHGLGTKDGRSIVPDEIYAQYVKEA